MAYIDREGGYRGNPWWVGVIVALVLLGFCTRGAGTRDSSIGRVASMTTEGGAEHALLSDPEAGPIFATLKESFPEEFARLRQTAQTAAANRDEDAVRAAVSRELLQVMRRNDRHAVQAPHAELEAARQAELAMVERLRSSSPELCGVFVSTGLDGTSRLTPETQQLLVQLNIAQIRMAAAGRDTPVGRPQGAPDPRSIAALSERMRANGISGGAMELLTGARAPDNATATMQCDLAHHYLAAIGEMPAEEADRLFVAPLADASPAAASDKSQIISGIGLPTSFA